MSFEQPTSPEGKIEKEAVIEMVKTNGFEDPETKALLNKWIDQRKVEIDGSENAGSGEGTLNMEISDIYLEAGKVKEAFMNLEDALEQADREGDVELQNKIVAKLKEIRALDNQMVKDTATFKLLPDNLEEKE